MVKQPNKRISNIPKPVMGMSVAVLRRLQAPEPEGFFTQGMKAVRPVVTTLGKLSMLTLTSALGVLVVAIAYNNSRYGGTTLELEVTFLSGLLLIFVPVMVRLLSNAPSRFERISLLCFVGLCFYLIKLMVSPLYVSSFDEFLHWRPATNIAMTGHLFGPNPLLPVNSYYS